MKPRRENGATFVSPMTSEVCIGSALMMDFLGRVWGSRSSPHPCSKPVREIFGENFRNEIPDQTTMESWVSRSVLKTNLGKKDGTLQGGMWEPHSASNCRGTQITSLRGCGWYHGGWGGFGHAAGRKEQGRRRSITLTALPAPDIEIGLRRPV